MLVVLHFCCSITREQWHQEAKLVVILQFSCSNTENLSGVDAMPTYLLVLTRCCTCSLLLVCCGCSSFSTLSEKIMFLGVLFITVKIAYLLLSHCQHNFSVTVQLILIFLFIPVCKCHRIGVISGNVIFGPPLQKYWAEKQQQEAAKEGQTGST